MKKNTTKYLIGVGVIVFFAAIALTVSHTGASALSVNDVSSDPTAYTGVVTIVGIVAGVSQQDPSIIGMMDKKELQCTSPNCKKIYLPFKAKDYSAVRGDEVLVTGTFNPDQGGFLFIAESVKVVKNHNIGG
jgi:hypothetical protein